MPHQDELSQNLADLLSLVDHRDPTVALQELARRMKSSPIVFKNCHGLAHEIGHEAYKKYNDFALAMQYQDSVCADGYLHGVIEERFRFARSMAAVLREMRTICKRTGKEAGRCYHGVGHGLMFFFENNLPKALLACRIYNGGARHRCYEGAFMDNFLADGILHPSRYLDSSNPFYPCPTELSGLQPYCYFYAPIYFLRLHNNDYVAALRWCASNPAAVHVCMKGVGSLAMKYSIADPRSAERTCTQSPTRDEAADCIQGMASYYRTFTGDAAAVRTMCLQLERTNQLVCRGMTGKAAVPVVID
jgi:hypothetical protein